MKANKMMKLLLAMALSLSLAVFAGCGSQSSQATDDTGSQTTTQTASAPDRAAQKDETPHAQKAAKSEQKTMTIKVYYPDDQAMQLIGSDRQIDYTDTDKYTAAVEALMQAPDAKGQNAIIPKQAKLNSVSVDGDTATVDFSQDLKQHFVGGSAGEEMLVGSIVDTLTQFPEIKQVQITLAGKKIASLAGHMDFSEPFTRMDNLIAK